VPDSVPEINIKKDTKLVDALLEAKIVSSKTEFRRLVAEGAITDMDKNEKVKDGDAKVLRTVYKIGKHRFIKIKQ
jgi:tyrosyl-tRNA synthetase